MRDYLSYARVEIITNIIVEYLKHNKRLCVPKLGTFIVKQSSGSIVFSDLMRGDDGVLRSLLMAAGMRELEANGAIDRFVFEIRHAVSVEGSTKIEGLGEFSANINNTITFTPVSQTRVIGGNIKPPVEIIQRRMPPRQEVKPAPYAARPAATKSATRNTKSTTRNTKSEEETLTLGKPDAYLRGLKYDSRKNKKREEMGHGKRTHGGGKGWIIVLLLAIIIGGAAYILWPRTTILTPPPANIVEEVIASDTTLLDTLPAIDSLNTANTTEEMLPATTVTPQEIINE